MSWASELRKRKEDHRTPRPLAAAVHVFVPRTDRNDKLSRRREATAAQIALRAARGATGDVLPAWVAKGAIQPPPALLEVRGCDLTDRSLPVDF